MATAKIKHKTISRIIFGLLLFIGSQINISATPMGTLPAWTESQIAVIINDSDPQSIRVANYYRVKRHIPPSQMIHVNFPPGKTTLTEKQFKSLKQQVDNKTPVSVQGYVLSWTLPYKVACMSITSAFAAGFDKSFCAQGCQETRRNPYFNSNSSKPYTQFGWRPTMSLAGASYAQVKQLIDRGFASDYTYPNGSGYLLKTSDTARSTRALDFPATAAEFSNVYPINYLETDFIVNKRQVMFYFTGLAIVPKITTNTFLPGAVADHLTSFGGVLNGTSQMSILRWLEAGLTGSYGTVIEPCNFPVKFSNPSVLLHYYLGGNTLIESYWKSVAEPGQGLFIGDPLARPFAKRITSQ